LGLTALTVAVTGIGAGLWGVLGALIIASVKASLVLRRFMHLAHEPPLFKVIVSIVIAAVVIFIGLTYTDVLFR
jgi:cytochrome c oxidase subunit 4